VGEVGWGGNGGGSGAEGVSTRETGHEAWARSFRLEVGWRWSGTEARLGSMALDWGSIGGTYDIYSVCGDCS